MTPQLHDQIRLQPRHQNRHADRRRRSRLRHPADHSDPRRRGARARASRARSSRAARISRSSVPTALPSWKRNTRSRSTTARCLYREHRHPLRAEGSARPHRARRDRRSRADLFPLGAEIRDRQRKIPLADGEPVHRRRRPASRPRRDRGASGDVRQECLRRPGRSAASITPSSVSGTVPTPAFVRPRLCSALRREASACAASGARQLVDSSQIRYKT